MNSKKRTLEPIKLVPITFPEAFKIMWGDENGKDRITLLLSKYFNIDYDILLENINFLSVDYIKSNLDDMYNNDEKEIDDDILIRINFTLPNEKRVNVEMFLNSHNLNVERNLSYMCEEFYSIIKDLEDDEETETLIQINFNREFVNEETSNPVAEYLFRSDEGEVWSENFRIVEINIDECERLWNSNTIDQYTKYSKDFVRLCALMKLENKELFDKCLNEIDMDEELRENIKDVADSYSKDDTLIISDVKK